VCSKFDLSLKATVTKTNELHLNKLFINKASEFG